MRLLACGFLGACLLGPVVCLAQLATPQWRQPGVDSTHVLGTAMKVMPEYVVPAPPDAKPSPEQSPSAPTTIQELLSALDGVVLTMPGNESRGANGQIRVLINATKAQVQETALWNWYDTCSATAQAPSCGHGVYLFQLSPEGLFVVPTGCGAGSTGSTGGTAEFKWVDFVALGGLSGATKSWLLQRSSLWESCHSDNASG